MFLILITFVEGIEHT